MNNLSHKSKQRSKYIKRQDKQTKYIKKPITTSRYIKIQDTMSKQKSNKIKKSSGIACLKLPKIKNNKIKILLVRKRLSYSFCSFVFGHYDINNKNNIIGLFNTMTSQEKIDISSLRFDLLWYRFWLEFPENDSLHSDEYYSTPLDNNNLKNTISYHVKLQNYVNCKNKFNNNFLQDCGILLKSLLLNTTNINLLWEIPKGKKNEYETDIDCAVREFTEETGLLLNQHKILFDIEHPIIDIKIDKNTKYINTYYLSLFNNNKDIINRFNINNIYEIDSVKWFSIDEIYYMNNKHLHDMVQKIFSVFKDYNII